MKKESKKDNSYLETICDKVGEIAIHYGFTVVKPPHITTNDTTRSKQFKEHDYYGDTEEKIAITNWYINQKMETQGQPVAIHYKKPLSGSSLKKKSSEEMYGFEIMGSNRSTSEALLLKCVIAVLEDLGYKDLYIDINSIGDRESIARYERELSGYYRKHGNNLSVKLRQELKKNHYAILKDTSTDNQTLRQNAPQTLSCLSDISRLHFKEVLECVEAFNVIYKIKPSTLSNKHFASYTVFEIRKAPKNSSVDIAEDGELLAYGYRYNYLAKKMGAKREIPSIGATIIVKKNPATTKKILIKKIKKPRFYLVQLGNTAKLKALNVVELLRKNKIPIYHSITKDKITGQLSGAEYMKATHVLIMGQKEALENTVVVRSISNREQETVPIDKLVEFLKGLK